ncbi:MAG TPA: class II aldolase/adducin family protein [Candidatus Omnitrophota bacterium]|nr:class II aldolase/adducin family protein [Candidatus Omnitrophota bacterium]
MAIEKERNCSREIVAVGKNLYDRFLVVGRSGNISSRLGPASLLITATGSALGALSAADIVKVDLSSRGHRGVSRRRAPSSELPMHSLIYRSLPDQKIIHCHPPLTNAYFAVYPSLKELIHETRFCLGEVPVIPQKTVTVTDPQPVIEALKRNKLVVLQNHGVVAVADRFEDAFFRIETLESAVHIVAVARLFKRNICDGLDAALRRRMRAQRRTR